MNNNVVIVIFALIIMVLFINMFKFVLNFFSNRKRYIEVSEVRREVNNKIKPRLGSLEKKFERDENSGDKLGTYVFNLFKDEFKDKNKKIVEKEICKCCNDYSKAECKEDFCLEGFCKK